MNAPLIAVGVLILSVVLRVTMMKAAKCPKCGRKMKRSGRVWSCRKCKYSYSEKESVFEERLFDYGWLS